ncbi:hypothetical protein D3C75_1043580 [compost metagenome]
MHVIGAHHTRWFTGGEVIRHATANNDDIARHQRGRGLLIVAWFDLTHAHTKVDRAVVAKVFAQLAGVGVDGNQARIGRRQEQAT